MNFLNEWGLTLIGLALLLGLFVRFACVSGVLLMALYYLSALDFPYPDPHSFIVDQHVIYIFILLFLAFSNAGTFYGLDARRHSRS